VTTIEKIKERLSSYPAPKYIISGSTITIEAPSPDGFSVSLIEGTTEWIVHFDGWHEHFDTEDEALNCFMFGLSNECRLQITLRGTFPYRWTVQKGIENEWDPDSTTGLIFFPFWRRKRVEYRQNDVLNGI